MWINQTSRQQFVDFLLEAKRTTYAAQGDEATVTPLVPGSKQLEYCDGDHLYRDIYFGMAYFAGQEVVFHREQAVWSPYRGPAAFTRDLLTYTNASSGSPATFSGVEGISRDGAQIYECRYAGGLLR